jgi:putative salt-induced outer membrane protein YdiY
VFGTTFLEGWTKNIGAGISGSDGTTSEVTVSANVNGQYTDEKHRRKFQANLYISKPNSPDDKTDRKAFVEYEENYKPFDNSIYLIGTVRYDYDRALTANSRIAPSAGVGCDLHQSEDLTIRASVGAGLSHTWDRKGDTVPEGVLRGSADYNVTKGVIFATTHTYYPNIEDSDELRVISNAELKADIGEEGGLSASVGLNNEYDTTADDDVKENKKNDLTYFLRLGYDF